MKHMALEKPSEAEPSLAWVGFRHLLNNDLVILWAIVFIAWLLTIWAAATGTNTGCISKF
jgi:hypothetical protein